MKDQKSLKHVAFSLMLLPVLLITVRTIWKAEFTEQVENKFEVVLDYAYAASEPFFITTFLPVNDARQDVVVKSENSINNEAIFMEGPNKKVHISEAAGQGHVHVKLDLIVKKHAFEVQAIGVDQVKANDEFKAFTYPTDEIQSSDVFLTHLTAAFVRGKSLRGALFQLYDYVKDFEVIEEAEYNDALTTLKRKRGSVLGKNRAFLAMCRSLKLPSRMVGGLILKEEAREHQWVEVYTAGNWVPFDLNYNHFARLPMNYVSLYRGEEKMLDSSASTNLIHSISITQIQDDEVAESPFNMVHLAEEVNIPKDMLMLLLMLPLGAFLVGIFKNVIGLKTYGMFIPVLLSMSFLQTGLLPGILLFTTMIAAVVVVNYPLEKWGIQYNSKITAMLFAVVGIALISIRLLHTTGWLDASAPLFFPMIILTFISEKVAKKIEEEGAKAAVELYGTTLLVTLFIFLILSSPFIQQLILGYPELLLSVAGINLLLGKWIGLRVMEYYRFFEVIKART